MKQKTFNLKKGKNEFLANIKHSNLKGLTPKQTKDRSAIVHGHQLLCLRLFTIGKTI